MTATAMPELTSQAPAYYLPALADGQALVTIRAAELIVGDTLVTDEPAHLRITNIVDGEVSFAGGFGYVFDAGDKVQILSRVAQSPSPAATLRRLADALDGMSQARVSPPDVYRALHQAAPTYGERRPAIKALVSSLDRARGYEGWLDRWTVPQSRVEVVARVRAAAEQAEAAPAAPEPIEPGTGICTDPECWGCTFCEGPTDAERDEQPGAVSRG